MWLLWALENFRRFTLRYITLHHITLHYTNLPTADSYKILCTELDLSRYPGNRKLYSATVKLSLMVNLLTNTKLLYMDPTSIQSTITSSRLHYVAPKKTG